MPRSVNYIILNSVLLIKKRMLFNIYVLLFIIHFIRFFFFKGHVTVSNGWNANRSVTNTVLGLVV